MIKLLFTTATVIVTIAGCPGRQAEGCALDLIMELLPLQSTLKFPCMEAEEQENRLCFSTPHFAATVKGGLPQSESKSFLTQFSCLTMLATLLSSIPKPNSLKTGKNPMGNQLLLEVQQL